MHSNKISVFSNLKLALNSLAEIIFYLSINELFRRRGKTKLRL